METNRDNYVVGTAVENQMMTVSYHIFVANQAFTYEASDFQSSRRWLSTTS